MWTKFAALLGSTATLVVGSQWAPTGHTDASHVMLFLSTDCPKAALYSPRIASLERDFSAKGFKFTAYFPNDLESLDSIRAYATERKFDFDVHLDLGASVAKQYSVQYTPEVVVTDSLGVVVYQGAIDDNADTSLVKAHYLRDALTSLSEGKQPAVAKTQPFGCFLMPSQERPLPANITYAEHIAPILYKNCTECHRPGEVAPFSLIGYENARKWAKNVASVTSTRIMPPWKAVHGFGEFVGEKRLSDTEIETLRAWAESGTPRGDQAREPETPKYPSGWNLGQPELILSPKVPFQLEADGADVYRNFVFKTDYQDARYVTAIDVKPGNNRVVHHVIAYVDAGKSALALDQKNKDGQEGYTSFGGPGFVPDTSFGGWAPGFRASRSPEGTGFLLKPGATIVLQIHYHKTGKPATDQTQLGIYFADGPVEKTLEMAWLANVGLRIPANAQDHHVKYTFGIPRDITTYGVLPHMHLLGRSMKAEIQLPDGTIKPMIFVDDWDFRWQIGYQFKEPIKIPKGSRIVAEAVYDNSAQNPNQPNNPPKDVRWGDQTTDEMFLLVMPFTRD